MNKTDMILVIGSLVLCILLYFLAETADRYKNSKWKLLWLVPAVFCLLLTAINGPDMCLAPIYISALVLYAGFYIQDKNKRKLFSAVSAALTVTGFLLTFAPAYRAIDYLEEFNKTFTVLKERYVLAEHKNIDWDMLYEKYEPLFREATEKYDDEEGIALWMSFTNEFCDGHTGYQPYNEKALKKMQHNRYGSDYGLVLVSLEDGRTAAVNVDESVTAAAGIHDGTIITSWNGMTPEEANKLSSAHSITGYPDAENDYFYRTILAAGYGSGDITVGYYDDDGKEKTAQLSPDGYYYERYKEVIKTLNDGVSMKNLTVDKINETTACLRIGHMLFDADSESENDYSGLKNDIRKKINELKQNGIKNAVIDIRSNGGGSAALVKSIAELFAPEGEHLYAYDGVWDSSTNRYKTGPDGQYCAGDALMYRGEDILNGGNVVILVNAYSASASDHMAAVMGALDNVTVMGFTRTCGSAQASAEIEIESGAVSYSGSVVLNEDGSIFIDAGSDRKSGAFLDIRVPFDTDALEAMFVRNEDWLMSKALEHIKSCSENTE